MRVSDFIPRGWYAFNRSWIGQNSFRDSGRTSKGKSLVDVCIGNAFGSTLNMTFVFRIDDDLARALLPFQGNNRIWINVKIFHRPTDTACSQLVLRLQHHATRRMCTPQRKRDELLPYLPSLHNIARRERIFRVVGSSETAEDIERKIKCRLPSARPAR